MAVSPKHKKLEKALIDLVESKGFIVKCSSSYGPKICDEVDSIIPDLKAKDEKEDLLLFGEVETEESLDTEHTKDQIKVLANRQMKSNKKTIPFYLAIPKGSKATAQKVLKDIKYDEKKNIHIVEF